MLASTKGEDNYRIARLNETKYNKIQQNTIINFN